LKLQRPNGLCFQNGMLHFKKRKRKKKEKSKKKLKEKSKEERSKKKTKKKEKKKKKRRKKEWGAVRPHLKEKERNEGLCGSSFERRKKEKKGEKQRERDTVLHRKIMIYEDLTVQTQIRFPKRDLRTPIYVSTDWFEVFSQTLGLWDFKLNLKIYEFDFMRS
jgi:phage protein D